MHPRILTIRLSGVTIHPSFAAQEESLRMPGLDTTIHVDMWREYHRKNSLVRRVRRATHELLHGKKIYGLEWGDPEVVEPLAFLRNRYVLPYVKAEDDAVEIGPGGGRWSRYLLGFRTLYLVDYHRELLGEVQKNFRRPNVRFIHNNGSDFPGIPDASIAFVFSFGCFVHFDRDLIRQYLANLPRILKPGGNVVIHYSDQTKIMAQINPGFSDNSPAQMREMIGAAGFRIVEEDLTTMWNGSIVRFTL
jgi:SAM-dependent methyltransferase